MRPLPCPPAPRFPRLLRFPSIAVIFLRPSALLGGLRAWRRRWSLPMLLVLLLASPAALLGTFAWRATSNAALGSSRAQDAANQAKVGATYGKMPLYFVENQGQTDARVAYYAHGRSTSIFFTPQGVTYALTAPGTPSTTSPAASHSARAQLGREAATASDAARQRWAVAVDFVGANPAVRPVGQERTEAVVSYFRGPQAEWKTGLPTYQRVVYANLWPGIDLVYEGTAAGALEYTFLIQPGADPQQIQLAYRGATTVTRTPAGQLAVTTPIGSWTEDIPYAYQEGSEGQRIPITATHALRAGAAEATPVYSFALGAYDRSQSLVLDPVVFVYSGFIGGAGFDQGNGITVDSTGNAYITGQTSSDETTFPVTVGPDLTYNGSFYDAFVAKVKADGSALVYLGYIGGAGGFSDVGQGIAVDKDGNAYVAGTTYSDQATFPVMVGPDLSFNGGGSDAFVAKINASGKALLYCGYIGGAGFDQGNGIAVDSFGNASITGNTSSNEMTFPAMVGPDLTYNGGLDDAFVAKVAASGKTLLSAGYIGGADEDDGKGITLDSTGNAYITGMTWSTQATFPVTVGPDLTYNDFGAGDAFVAKVADGGKTLLYAGYIGGVDQEDGKGIAVDSFGNAYIAGFTLSTPATFPVMVGPDLTYNGGGDAFVAKVKADGTGLVYCGYLGGAGDDFGEGIAVDSFGKAYVTGATSSNQLTFPVTGGPDLTYNGVNFDAFVAKVKADGTGLMYAGYIGGHDDDLGFAIAVDAAGSAYVTGVTRSIKGFPVKVGPDPSFNGGGTDAFVTKVAQLVFVPVPLPILIQPGSSVATLNPASRGELPVAILSTDEFDATVDVDLATVRFGATGTEAAPLRATRADVNEDGLPDLLLHVAIPDTAIACGDTSAALSGRTVDGQEITGSALIQTVGCTIRR
jgi:Beta-propeller repeat